MDSDHVQGQGRYEFVFQSVLLLITAVAHGTTYHTTEAVIEDTESLEGEVDAAQPNF